MIGNADIIIVGTGVSGLFCALNLPKDRKILMITKQEAEKSDSFLAQGGICVMRGEEDYDEYYEDTMRAGHYENDEKSVEVMIRMSPEIIQDLIKYNVEFENNNGELVYTKEGAHSNPRILFHEDLTGKEITSKLLKEVKVRDNIDIIEHTVMIDVISEENICKGVVVVSKEGEINYLYSDYVIMATGGIGGLYDHSTNFPHITGDSLAIALKNNIELKNIDYIQIHPTTLYSKKPGRRFLISESVRGEGACLYNAAKERFVDELLPRDVLTKEILEQMKKDETEYVWLSMIEMGAERIKKRFPNIYKKCLDEGYDITKEFIPVTPAQHYYMGGIKVNQNSMTSMKHLYAVGETSCNGVHGANRLASNSLLESLVFSKRSAIDIKENYEEIEIPKNKPSENQYKDIKKLKEEYKKMILAEIERRKAK